MAATKKRPFSVTSYKVIKSEGVGLTLFNSIQVFIHIPVLQDDMLVSRFSPISMFMQPPSMVDTVSSETRSRIMSGIRGYDTKPELLIRKGLHSRGLRFRRMTKGYRGNLT